MWNCAVKPATWATPCVLSFVYIALLKSFFCFFSCLRWYLSLEKIDCGRNTGGSHSAIPKLCLLGLAVIRDFQEYVEPGEDFPASPQRRATAAQEDRDDSVVLPLGADTLTHNLGLPVLVVCTKVSVLPGSLAERAAVLFLGC